MSVNKRNKERRNAKALNEYRKKFPRCQYCGFRNATDIHEILSGPLREKARELRSCILHLCRTCHDQLQYAGICKNLAVKYYSDPAGFDLLEVNQLRGHSPVTMKDIDLWLNYMEQADRS